MSLHQTSDAKAINAIVAHALDRLRHGDNEYSWLLALRNAITALHPFGDRAIEARKRITNEVRACGVSDTAIAGAIEAAMGKVVRLADYKPSPQERHLVERLGLTFPCIPYDAPVTKRGTPQSTVDALMWGLRDRGLSCIDDPGNLDRLRRCDVDAMEQISKRLLALGWESEVVEKLIKAWRVLRGSRS